MLLAQGMNCEHQPCTWYTGCPTILFPVGPSMPHCVKDLLKVSVQGPLKLGYRTVTNVEPEMRNNDMAAGGSEPKS